MRGLAGEGSRWLARLLDLAEYAVPPPPPRARGRALAVAGHLAWHRNDLQPASTLTEAGLAIQRGLDDRTWMGLSLYNLGRVALEAGDLARAQALNEELLALQQTAGSPWFLAWALLSLGHVARERGDVAATRARYQESLGAAQWLDDRWTTGIVLAHLGALATAEEDYPTAQEFLGESVRLLREHGDNVQIVLSLEGLARFAAVRGQTRRALRLAGASAALRKAMGTPLSPTEQATFTSAMRAARQALSPSATAAIETEGSGMSLEQAVAFALEASAPDEEPAGVEQATWDRVAHRRARPRSVSTTRTCSGARATSCWSGADGTSGCSWASRDSALRSATASCLAGAATKSSHLCISGAAATEPHGAAKGLQSQMRHSGSHTARSGPLRTGLEGDT